MLHFLKVGGANLKYFGFMVKGIKVILLYPTDRSS
jgi:hypothetical protein